MLAQWCPEWWCRGERCGGPLAQQRFIWKWVRGGEWKRVCDMHHACNVLNEAEMKIFSNCGAWYGILYGCWGMLNFQSTLSKRSRYTPNKEHSMRIYICCVNVHPSKMPKTNQMQNKNDDMIENVHRSSNAIEHAE